MKQVSFGIVVVLALGAGPVIAQQAQASSVSTGRAKVCRDSKGAAYSTGALLKAADGSIDRCEEGEWVPAPDSAAGGAQQRRGQSTQTPQPSAQGQQQPMPGRAARPGLATNVQLDITINDQTSAGQPLKKSIRLLLADQANGRVRSTGMVHQQRERLIGPEQKVESYLEPLFQVELNVDAFVELLQDDKVRAGITLEYTPGLAGAVVPAETNRPSPLNESVTVILTNGKPLVITQAADPVSDRKITVEVLATILGDVRRRF